MKRVLKWAGIILGSLVGLIAVAVGVTVAISMSRQSTTYDVRVEPIELPTDEASLAEGERLFLARGCGECHGANGTGRVIMDAAPARVVGSNLTVVTRGWGVEDHLRAIRHGVRPDGSPLVFMPSHEFHGMSDADASRIIAHYTRFPRRESHLPPTEVRVLGRVLHTLGVFPLLPAELIDHDAPIVQPPEPGETVAYGEYLAVGCTGCHGDELSGGPIPGAPAELGTPANLTPHETGLAGWTRADFERVMRTGVSKDGHRIDPAQMPWRTFNHMTDVELGALWAYLSQVPARPFGER